MKTKIQQIAQRVLGYTFYIEDDEIELRTGANGKQVLLMGTVVKAYGDGWRKEYDTAYPDDAPRWDAAVKFAEEVMRTYPQIGRVSVVVDGD